MKRYIAILNEYEFDEIVESDSLEDLTNMASGVADVPVYEQIGFIQMKPKFVGFVDKADEENIIQNNLKNFIQDIRDETNRKPSNVIPVTRIADNVKGKYHIRTNFKNTFNETALCGIWVGSREEWQLTCESNEVPESQICKNCLKCYNGPPINFGSPLLIGR